MDGISRSRGWDKVILHGILPMEQLVLSNRWVKNLLIFKGIRDTWTNFRDMGIQCFLKFGDICHIYFRDIGYFSK